MVYIELDLVIFLVGRWRNTREVEGEDGAGEEEGGDGRAGT